MSTATVNGVDLAYVEQGQGEPVLFVHGGVGDYRAWDQQMNAFGAGYRAIALSCRGYWPNPKQRPELLRTLVLLEPPAFPLLGISIPPGPAQVIKLLIRHPRAGIGFVKFGARGMRPAIKAFQRGDDAGALRVFMAANTSDAVVE